MTTRDEASKPTVGRVAALALVGAIALAALGAAALYASVPSVEVADVVRLETSEFM